MNATLFHLGVTAAALVWHGPLWALICFLGVTVVRLALRIQALVLDNAELRRRLPDDRQLSVFESLGELQELALALGEDEPPPASETRPSRAVRALGIDAKGGSRSKPA